MGRSSLSSDTKTDQPASQLTRQPADQTKNIKQTKQQPSNTSNKKLCNTLNNKTFDALTVTVTITIYRL